MSMRTPKLFFLNSKYIKSSGFTIVELLIVVVVIGILAAIVTVAYTGISKTAQTASITSELKAWQKLLEAYKATNGAYPEPAASNPTSSGGPGSSALNRYCLGTGFPQSGGSGYCQVISTTSIYRIAESTGAYLLSQLSTVGVPPSNSTKYTYGTVVGPWLWYVNATNVRLYTTYPGGTTCPTGATTGYGNADRQDCYFILDYS